MLEASVLLVFVAGLLFCLIAGLPILLAILFGYLVFFAYGLSRGKRASRLLAASLAGIRSVKNILITFMLIGMLTAVWRACGTIATIICASTRVMRPDLMVMICFWLCCLISFLTGTSFGSAATMGVICMSISNVMGIPPVYAGGAILSGTFFGDRCSPMSTSAQLICAITGTDIYRNIRRMLQTCVVPFLLTSGLYLVLGLLSGAREAPADVIGIFERNYHLGWIPLIPALITVLFFCCGSTSRSRCSPAFWRAARSASGLRGLLRPSCSGSACGVFGRPTPSWLLSPTGEASSRCSTSAQSSVSPPPTRSFLRRPVCSTTPAP
ncbi:hypothetical protein CE91St46_34960 [Eubacteriales bacterium]|nr:hypothetical protein CE91St46_34960 [Eubacteriales bacterium]GKH65105.1 hypothetical protein CE91St47_35740 [Eubacteriales bacterium]